VKKEAGVRSFIITFDVYVILNAFKKYDNKRPDPICLELAADLMKELAPAVLDDDFEGLWYSDEVQRSLTASKDNTIFSLREARG